MPWYIQLLFTLTGIILAYWLGTQNKAFEKRNERKIIIEKLIKETETAINKAQDFRHKLSYETKSFNTGAIFSPNLNFVCCRDFLEIVFNDQIFKIKSPETHTELKLFKDSIDHYAKPKYIAGFDKHTEKVNIVGTYDADEFLIKWLNFLHKAAKHNYDFTF